MVLMKGEASIIIDVAVTFENGPKAFDSACQSSSAKSLRNSYKKVRVGGVVVEVF